MRTAPRKRHQVSRTTLRLLEPFFRYSTGRDAYVLRGIGGQFGPVLTERLFAVRPQPTVEEAVLALTGSVATAEQAPVSSEAQIS